MAQLASLKFHDQGGQRRVLVVELGAQQTQIVAAHGHHAALDSHQPVAVDGVVDDRPSVERFVFHQVHKRVEPRQRGVGIAQVATFVKQQDVGHRPALPALADDLIRRHAHVGEKHFVEVRVAGHRFQRPHADARRVHGKQQEAEALVLGRVGLAADQAEHPVGGIGRAGPNLLAVDDPPLALQNRAGGQAGQVAAGVGFGVAFAPDDFPAQRGADETLLLLLGAQLQQRGNQIGDSLSTQPRCDLGPGELFGDDVRLEQVRLRPVPAVLSGDGPGRVAVFDEEFLPGGRFFPVGFQSLGRQVRVGLEEPPGFLAKRLVPAAVRQVHDDVSKSNLRRLSQPLNVEGPKSPNGSSRSRTACLKPASAARF